QKSWVWCHFKLNQKTNKVQCLAPDSKKKGKPCGVFLSRDLTSSTKSMSEHLQRVHHMVPPNQDQTNQLLLPNLMKHQHAEIVEATFSPFNLQSITTGYWLFSCGGQPAFFNSGAAVFRSSPGTPQPSDGKYGFWP
ncbi:uncharacterized protein VP01_10819g1, partial [Puccinia sorghi]